MNTPINFSEKTAQIQRLLEKQEYTAGAREGVIIIEQALRQVAAQYMDRVDPAIKEKVDAGIRKRRKKDIDHLTMGNLVYLFKETKFLEACVQTAGKNLHSLQIISLENLTKLRNRFMHDTEEATSTEAEFLMNCLRVIVETFELDNNSLSGQKTAAAKVRHNPGTPHLSAEFHNRVVTFLTSLPTIEVSQTQRALLNSAGLDEGLHRIIDMEGSPSQLFHSLVPLLVKYGTLADGRDALEAILTAAQNWGGLEIRTESAALIKEWQAMRSPNPANMASPAHAANRTPDKRKAPAESLDTQILRVLYRFYQQNSGDPEMSFDEVLQVLPGHQPKTIQTQLFALKKKGWVGYELNTTGDAGLVWIEPKGIKIAKQLKN